MRLGPAALGICLLGPAEASDEAEQADAYDGRVQALEVAPLAPGEKGELSLLILDPVQAGVPMRVALSSEAVELPENRLGWRDVVDRQAVQLRVRGAFVAPKEPGSYPVQAHVTYLSCAGRWCRPRHARAGWTIEVAAPDKP